MKKKMFWKSLSLKLFRPGRKLQYRVKLMRYLDRKKQFLWHSSARQNSAKLLRKWKSLLSQLSQLTKTVPSWPRYLIDISLDHPFKTDSTKRTQFVHSPLMNCSDLQSVPLIKIYQTNRALKEWQWVCVIYGKSQY